MKFFSEKQIRMAYVLSYEELNCRYKWTENKLKSLAYQGDIKSLAETMEEHRDVEYALLFRLTPQYQSKSRNKR